MREDSQLKTSQFMFGLECGSDLLRRVLGNLVAGDKLMAIDQAGAAQTAQCVSQPF